MQKKSILPILVSYLAIFALLASLAMVRDGRLFGHKLTTATEPQIITKSGKSIIINTTDLCSDISGYAGPVPVEIYVTDNVVDSVVPLSNSESPGFFGRVTESDLFQTWNGKSLAEAAQIQVDAVSGATYSSTAVIENVRQGLAYAEGETAAASGTSSASDLVKWIIALLVIIAGAVVPLFVKNQRYRIVQQLLNVGVLGFWAGTFVDYAMMVGFFANGITLSLATIVILALLAVAFIYPLFGRHGYYCAWICPYGSLQELAGRLPVKKWKMSPALIRGLDTFRQILWCVLTLLLFIGWGAEWIDNEIFTFFFIKSAAIAVIVTGIAFIVLSLFIPRPFCRFVCPTGSILKQL